MEIGQLNLKLCFLKCADDPLIFITASLTQLYIAITMISCSELYQRDVPRPVLFSRQ